MIISPSCLLSFGEFVCDCNHVAPSKPPGKTLKLNPPLDATEPVDGGIETIGLHQHRGCDLHRSDSDDCGIISARTFLGSAQVQILC